MELIQAVYQFLNKYLTNEQLVYFGSFLTFLVAILSFYRNNLKTYVVNFISWIKNVTKVANEIDTIKSKINDIDNAVKEIKSINEPIIKTLQQEIQYIKSELSPNSGKSIKDLIEKIVHSVSTVEQYASSLEHQVKKIESRQWNIMINNNDYPMFECDQKGYFIRANKAYLDFVGLHLDDVVNMGWVNVIFIDDRNLVQNEWNSAIEDKRTFDLKYRIQNTITGKVHLVRTISQPYFVERELIGYIGRILIVSEMVQNYDGIWVKKMS